MFKVHPYTCAHTYSTTYTHTHTERESTNTHAHTHTFSLTHTQVPNTSGYIAPGKSAPLKKRDITITGLGIPPTTHTVGQVVVVAVVMVMAIVMVWW